MLGIESSCDDTGVAVVRASDGAILGQAIANQAIHSSHTHKSQCTPLHAHRPVVIPWLIDRKHETIEHASHSHYFMTSGA